jgi:hypothetical protein
MRSGRWAAISQSRFEWEREALDFLRDHLPDNEPWRAWSNFEFIVSGERRDDLRIVGRSEHPGDERVLADPVRRQVGPRRVDDRQTPR